MKVKTFFVVTLFFPYLCWIIVKAITITTPASSHHNSILELFSRLLNFINFIYVSTIWGWGIPYAILVIGLLIWSRNKSSQRIYRAAFYSPLLLPFLVVIEIIIAFLSLSLLGGTQSFWKDLLVVLISVPVIYLFAAIVVTPLGYIFVGFGLVVFKLLVRFKAIKVDEESMPSLSSMVSRSFKEIFQDFTSP